LSVYVPISIIGGREDSSAVTAVVAMLSSCWSNRISDAPPSQLNDCKFLAEHFTALNERLVHDADGRHIHTNWLGTAFLLSSFFITIAPS